MPRKNEGKTQRVDIAGVAKPWERLPNEPEHWHTLFQEYCQLRGVYAPLVTLYHQTGGKEYSLSAIRSTAYRYRWAERGDAYAHYIAEETAHIVAAQRAEIIMAVLNTLSKAVARGEDALIDSIANADDPIDALTRFMRAAGCDTASASDSGAVTVAF